ncbi:hypothetical protein PMYN1_Chma559 (chromatophore) [Paulinella micropora]|uniref:Uncharacterized protein n=1 Tax=Paulinella micropora TaxID=1928728 RepID=A0A5K7VV38_9EUKA|nr:hypothetical protein PMYN1_Chma559 [Paulinella micropora]
MLLIPLLTIHDLIAEALLSVSYIDTNLSPRIIKTSVKGIEQESTQIVDLKDIKLMKEQNLILR